MTDLSKGFSTSGLLHGLVLVAFLGTSWHSASGGRGNSPSSMKYGAIGADPTLISTPPPEAADPVTDVSDLASDPRDADNPFVPDPVKAPDLPVGMEILKPRDLRKTPPKTAVKKPASDKETPKTGADSTRLQKIREGLRKTLRPRTAPAVNPGATAAINSAAIRSRLGSQIKNEVVSVQVGGGLPSGNSLLAGGSPNGTGLYGGSGSGGRGDPFMDAITAVLYEAWQQPNKADVGQANPVVRARLTVQADGTISDYSVVKGSGNAAMDVTVKNLFRDLKKLPPLAQLGRSVPELTLTVDFVLDQN